MRGVLGAAVWASRAAGTGATLVMLAVEDLTAVADDMPILGRDNLALAVVIDALACSDRGVPLLSKCSTSVFPSPMRSSVAVRDNGVPNAYSARAPRPAESGVGGLTTGGSGEWCAAAIGQITINNKQQQEMKWHFFFNAAHVPGHITHAHTMKMHTTSHIFDGLVLCDKPRRSSLDDAANYGDAANLL